MSPQDYMKSLRAVGDAGPYNGYRKVAKTFAGGSSPLQYTSKKHKFIKS